jgi:GT2 family glycosyltransferase
MRIFVIIVCWNGRSNIEVLLPSLKQTIGDFNVVVVDNNSSDGTPEIAKALWPDVLILPQKKNLGFAGGNNVGFRFALEQKADLVVLLNDDTMIIDYSWLNDIKAAFFSNKKLGMLGLDLYPDVESAMAAESSTEIYEKEYIQGCAMVIRSEFLFSCGLFDEIYFAYGEEHDLTRRLELAGYEKGIMRRRVVHFGEATSSKIRDYASYLEIRNSIRYSIKWRPLHQSIARCLKYFLLFLLPEKFCSNIHYSHTRARGNGGVCARLKRLFTAGLWNITHFADSKRIASEQRAASLRHLIKKSTTR